MCMKGGGLTKGLKELRFEFPPNHNFPLLPPTSSISNAPLLYHSRRLRCFCSRYHHRNALELDFERCVSSSPLLFPLPFSALSAQLTSLLSFPALFLRSQRAQVRECVSPLCHPFSSSSTMLVVVVCQADVSSSSRSFCCFFIDSAVATDPTSFAIALVNQNTTFLSDPIVLVQNQSASSTSVMVSPDW